jgi:hypothetical protein
MKKKNQNSEIQTQSELLMTRIEDFFMHENHLKKMIDILSGTSNLSLRIIDWFVTNYSKKYDVIYALKKDDYEQIYDLEYNNNYNYNEIKYHEIDSENEKNYINEFNSDINIIKNKIHTAVTINEEMIDDIQKTKFIVFLEYKSQLKAFSKKQFDSFCRGERIKFNYIFNNQAYQIETTVGQLNFFRWGIQNNLFIYIEQNYEKIEKDMNESIQNKKNKKKEGNSKRIMYQPQNNAFQKKNIRVLVYFN